MRSQWDAILTAHQAQLWESYVEAEATKQSAIARQQAQAFAEAMRSASPDVCDHFAEKACRLAIAGEIDFTLRHPVFREILYPFLVRSYKEGIADAPFWIIGFYQELNLMPRTPRETIEIDFSLTDGFALLREGLRRRPKNPALTGTVVERFLQRGESSFAYAVHEVPAGVLYGIDGASLEERHELIADLSTFKELAEKWNFMDKYGTGIKLWDYHFRGYADYLERHDRYKNYEDYLSQHPFPS